MIKFACPTCGNVLSAPSRKGGKLCSCPACGQMVEIPAPAGGPAKKPRREGTRAFWALCRFFLWGICFAAVVLAAANYFVDFDKKADFNGRILLSVQSLIWILGSYYLARTFDDSTKSLEELCARLRRRRES